MLEIRFHGRGGQGAVTAAELLAVAAGDAGKFSQAFPFFGVERRGAPVLAFCRIDDKPITIHEQIYEPDVIVVLDDTLVEAGVDVMRGLKKGGTMILNTAHVPEPHEGISVWYVNATKIAQETLGVPIVNTAMLGALIRATNVVTYEGLEKAIRERFGKLAEKNLAATKACYESVVKR